MADFQMADPDQAENVDISAQDARQGETPGIVRYVLGVSLFLAVVAMGTMVWLYS